MITKVKDISKITLNPEDVMVKQIVRIKKGSSGIILDNLSEEQRRELKDDKLKLISMQIVAKGTNVHFEIGDYIETKGNTKINYEIIDSIEADGIILEQRLYVIHKNNIEFAVNPDNYEL